MADPPGAAERERTRRRRRNDSSEEWRLWRTFGICLALLIFALVVISTSL